MVLQALRAGEHRVVVRHRDHGGVAVDVAVDVPMPPTMPSAGVRSISSSTARRRRCAAITSGPYSTKVPSSTGRPRRAATRSTSVPSSGTRAPATPASAPRRNGSRSWRGPLTPALHRHRTPRLHHANQARGQPGVESGHCSRRDLDRRQRQHPLRDFRRKVGAMALSRMSILVSPAPPASIRPSSQGWTGASRPAAPHASP